MSEKAPDLKLHHIPGLVNLRPNPGESGVYGNVCNVQLTPEECILHFGQRDENDPTEGVSVAKVVLSLPHAKRLAIALTRTLQQYEKSFGEIQADILERLTPELKVQLADEIARLGAQADQQERE